MRRSARIVFGIAAFSALGWLGACQGDSAGPNGGVDPDLTEDADTVTLNASNALPGGPLASLSLTGPADVGMAAQVPDGPVTYISLKPGTVANGVRVVISNPRLGGTVTAAMTDGGFDPVPVRASAGDVIEIAVATATGERRFSVGVPPDRDPKVVRTVPPRGKTAVPLNAKIVIVFSEPVAAASLTPNTVQVLRGGTAIAGTARLLEGSTTAAVFDPSEPLEPNTVYKLVVNRGVTDLAGDSLSGRVVRDFTTGSVVQTVNHVRVRPDSLAIAVGDQAQLIATAFDFNGNPIAGLPVAWSSQNSAVASVSAAGLVTGVAPSNGEVRIFATIGGLAAGEVVLEIGSLVPIASVELSTDSAAIRVGGSQWLYVFLKTSDGGTVHLPRLTQWTSSNPAIATVADGGSRTAFVTGVREGIARIAVWVEGKSDTVTILVSNTARIAPSIIATTPANGATGVSRLATVSVTFLDHVDAQTIAGPSNNSAFTVTGGSGAISGEISISSENFRTYVFTPSRPLESGTTYTARVSTAVRDLNGNPLPAPYVWTFTTEAAQALSGVASISSYYRSTCALTITGAAYCWGENARGEFGDGTFAEMVWTAVPAGVGLELSAMSMGRIHMCGITVTSAAYCWGSNFESRLGIGASALVGSPTPRRVSEAVGFTSVSASLSHTCALTATGAAYCWGRGSLGDGVFSERSVPVPVAGGFAFSMVSAGASHSCGVTTTGAAFCWGSNPYGVLGDGTTELRLAPVPVSGGIAFSTLSTGGSHTCGIAVGGAAYCWGRNFLGSLGDGTTTDRLTPVPVTGGVSFSAVSAAFSGHTCGIAIGGIAYCWGGNATGQLGDGTTTLRAAPVPVAGGLTFIAIATGESHSCGVTTARDVYCWGSNFGGQLGNGSTTNSAIPVRVSR